MDSPKLFPLWQLYLTDLSDRLDKGPIQPDPTSNDDDADTIEKEARSNIKRLQSEGANGPYFRISGFPTSDSEPFKEFTTLLNGPPVRFSLVYWGSPHWADSDAEQNHGCSHRTTNDEFKTNAFESMAWLAPDAAVMMTFSSAYKLEFYHPLWKKPQILFGSRQLIVAEAHSRKYHPVASGAMLQPVRPNTSLMVAMLIPARLRTRVVYVDSITVSKVDIGATLSNIVEALLPQEKAIELGGQTFSLSCEILEFRESQCRSNA